MAMMASPDTIRNIRKSLHDLAQPLAAVAGLIDLLLLELDEDDPRLKEVRMISDQLEKVLQIVGEIRRMARGAPGAEPIMQSLAYPEP